MIPLDVIEHRVFPFLLCCELAQMRLNRHLKRVVDMNTRFTEVREAFFQGNDGAPLMNLKRAWTFAKHGESALYPERNPCIYTRILFLRYGMLIKFPMKRSDVMRLNVMVSAVMGNDVLLSQSEARYLDDMEPQELKRRGEFIQTLLEYPRDVPVQSRNEKERGLAIAAGHDDDSCQMPTFLQYCKYGNAEYFNWNIPDGKLIEGIRVAFKERNASMFFALERVYDGQIVVVDKDIVFCDN